MQDENLTNVIKENYVKYICIKYGPPVVASVFTPKVWGSILTDQFCLRDYKQVTLTLYIVQGC